MRESPVGFRFRRYARLCRHAFADMLIITMPLSHTLRALTLPAGFVTLRALRAITAGDYVVIDIADIMMVIADATMLLNKRSIC